MYCTIRKQTTDRRWDVVLRHFLRPLNNKRKCREVPGSIPGRALGIFQVACYYCPHSVALEFTQPITETSKEKIPWGYIAAGAWS